MTARNITQAALIFWSISLQPAALAAQPAEQAQAAVVEAPKVEVQPLISGSERHVALAQWALGRFNEAGLALPEVTINFHESKQPCKGHDGLTQMAVGHIEINVCRLAAARRILLHELAHVWAFTTLDEEARQEFVGFRNTASWNTDGSWYEHASEQAAEIIAWTLMEGFLIMRDKMPEMDVASLEAGYEALTGNPIPNWDGKPDTPLLAGRPGTEASEILNSAAAEADAQPVWRSS